MSEKELFKVIRRKGDWVFAIGKSTGMGDIWATDETEYFTDDAGLREFLEGLNEIHEQGYRNPPLRVVFPFGEKESRISWNEFLSIRQDVIRKVQLLDQGISIPDDDAISFG